MKLGVITVPLYDRSLDEALGYLKNLGVESVEMGAGGFPGDGHSHREELLSDKAKLQAFKDTFKKHDMTISALSCHGNAVHPNKEIAKKFHDDFERTCILANELEIPTVITFSGCPGDSENAKYPNWVTCPWPDDFLSILEWQWNDVLIPYWQKEADYAKGYGVNEIAFEMHPGFCVYNTETMLKIRKAVGPTIGANVDPSHLIWQGMDPVEVIRVLGKEKAIFNFHAKDTRIDKTNTAVNGVLDTKHYSDEINRSWVFRSLGYGNGETFWRDIVSMLQLVGYNKSLAIEHEDSVMTCTEGLEKAINFLKSVIIKEDKPGGMFWA